MCLAGLPIPGPSRIDTSWFRPGAHRRLPISRRYYDSDSFSLLGYLIFQRQSHWVNSEALGLAREASESCESAEDTTDQPRAQGDEERRAILESLRNSDDEDEIVVACAHALRDDDEIIRMAAANELKRVTHSAANAVLLRALSDNDLNVRRTAAFAMRNTPPGLVRTWPQNARHAYEYEVDIDSVCLFDLPNGPEPFSFVEAAQVAGSSHPE